MDLLYRRYASPMELMRIYIDNGRFGEFVENIIESENRRRKEAYEKEEDNKLWQAYNHSYSDKNFADWKKGLVENNKPQDLSMDDAQVSKTIEQARGILKRISPA